MKRLLLMCVFVLLLCQPAPVQARETALGILYIPAIDLLAYVQVVPAIGSDGQSTYDLTALGEGVAWLEGTGWVQHSNGRIVLAGHTPGGFERLHEMKPGDRIYLITEYGMARYVVTDLQTVEADDTRLWYARGGGQSLVLMTCDGVRRLFVIAQREEGR